MFLLFVSKQFGRMSESWKFDTVFQVEIPWFNIRTLLYGIIKASYSHILIPVQNILNFDML